MVVECIGSKLLYLPKLFLPYDKAEISDDKLF